MKIQVSKEEPNEPARTKIIQNPHPNPMRQRVNLLHARRKWSDWSECSAECIKTRHRMNCDDIVQAGGNQSKANNIKQLAAFHTKPSPRTISTQVEGVGRQMQITERRLLTERHTLADAGRQNDNEDEDELVYKADQADDDDYADEGDEEEETDSCSNVDTSKTFEQSACLGGLCRLPSLGATSPVPGLASNPDTNTRQRTNNGGFSQQKHQRRKQQRPPVTGIHSEETVANGEHQLASKEQHVSPERPGAATAKQPLNVHKNNTHQARSDSNFGLFGGSMSNSSLPEQNAIDKPAIWTTTGQTKSMWPPQLSYTGTDLQANLIQWTILIGSLLALILLIMLIIRKLFVSTFPSYRWLLAKQTAIKSPNARVGSIRGRLVRDSKECNCKHQPHQRHQSLAGLSGTQLLCDEASQIIQHHHQVGSISRQLCQTAEWRGQINCTAQSSGNLASTAYQQYLLTEATGRRLLGGDGSGDGCSDKYEIDYADLPTCAKRASSSATHSSRGSGSGKGFKQRRQDEPGFAVISGYNYDTLDEGAHRRQRDANQLIGDKGFILTRDFVAQSCGSEQLVSSAGTKPVVLENSPACVAQMRLNSAKQNLTDSRPAKSYREDGMERCQQDDDLSPLAAELNAQSRSGSLSIASSVADDSTASNSVQSTTAQMLSSNAGSSSFEQHSSNEFASQNEFNTPGSSVVLIQNPISIGCSPATSVGCGKPRHNNSIKLMNACPQTAQSQPSSPMLMNSFNPNRPLARYKAPKLSVRVRAVRDHDNVNANEDSGYAQPDQSGIMSTDQRDLDTRSKSVHKPNYRQDQSVLKLARTFESKSNCDNDERHFYEEISNPHR